MAFDSEYKRWEDLTPEVGDAPYPRSGHLMWCFYHYLVVFGGDAGPGRNSFASDDPGSVEENHFSDLWVFDILKRDWHPIIDAS